MSLRGGVTRCSPCRAKLGLLALLLVALAGCGAGESVGDGAVASVYVAAPLCAEAREELARRGGEAGGIRVRAVCLPPVEKGGRLDLAQIGANARRAVEDSSTVGYIGERSGRATRFSRPILESAEVPQLPNQNGATAMNQLLKAIAEASDMGGSLRQAVNAELE